MIQKPKVIFLVNSFQMGGAERVLSILNKTLDKKFKIEFYSLKNSKTFFSLKNKPIPLSSINNNFLMILHIPKYIKQLRKIIEIEKPDCIISFLEISNFINILSNPKAIVSFRTSLNFFRGIKGFFYKKMIYFLYPRATKIIVNSVENKEELQNYLKISGEKITYIQNPIDLEEIKKNEKLEPYIESWLKNKRVFISVGRLEKSKNYESLITGFNQLIELDNSNILMILGDGPEKNYLEELVKNLRISNNIKLFGKKENVFKYLKKSDYFVFTSLVEGFPNVLLEAMAVGLPIITTDFKTGARELITPELALNKKISYPYFGQNGVLINPNNINKDLLSVYKKLNNIKKNPELIKKYSIQNVTKRWEYLIENLIKK